MISFLTDQIAIWSAAQTAKTNGRGNGGDNKSPHGFKKLRELILELAVRGKLVPQDPNDEPASVLLEKIAKEKKRLIKEGKIKKQETLPEIGEDEKPFELPQGWEWARLGEITNYGISDKAEPKDVNGSTWVLELEDIEKETSRLLQKVRFADRQFRSSKNRFLQGDVLYGKLRPYLDKVIVADEDGVCTTEMIPLRGYSNITNKYLRLVMKTPYFIRYADESTHGMNLPRLGTEKARLALFPLVAEAEQHHIVAKVNELMALCDKLEQQQTDSDAVHQTLVETLLAALTTAVDHREFTESWHRIADHFDTLFTNEHSIDQLKQTILQLAVMGKLVPQDPNDEPAESLLVRAKAAKKQLIVERQIRHSDEAELSDPDNLFELPAGWAWAHVKDVAIVQGGKRLPNGAVLLETPTPHTYIRVTDMKNGTISENGLMYISPEVQREISRYIINKNDLYITIAGTIGNVGVIPDSLDGQNLTENAAKLVFRVLYKRFFQLVLSSDFVQRQFLEKTKQMAQPKLALKRIAGAKICISPLAEQHRIVAKIDELMALCDALKERVNDAQTTQVQLADALVEQAISLKG